MIYFDYAASTPVDKRVLDVMLPYFTDLFANPSNITHKLGIVANRDVEVARNDVAQFLGCYSQQIFWTSGATESNNLALQGAVSAFQKKYPGKTFHIITSVLEHKSVLEPCEYISRNNIEVSFVEPNIYGEITKQEVENHIKDNTILVSIMMANNEIGVVNDLKPICDLCIEKGILMHTDATQIIGKDNLNVFTLGVDFLTFSGHKIYAPKGIGVLYVRDVSTINPIVFGGGHENGIRPGTSNVPSIIGIAEACKIYIREKDAESKKLLTLRNKFENILMSFSDKIILNGFNANRLPNLSSVSFSVKDGNNILNAIKEDELIACSSGSACDTPDNKPSHVLKAIGKTRHEAKNTIRFSFGRFTSEKEIVDGGEYLIRLLNKFQ